MSRMIRILFCLLVAASPFAAAQDCGRCEWRPVCSPVSEESLLSSTLWASIWNGHIEGRNAIDRTYTYAMVAGSLGYQFGADSPHEVHLDMALKVWDRSDGQLLQPACDGRHFGLSAYYRYSDPDTKLTVGLQTMDMDNYLLLNDQVLGVALDQSIGAFKLDLYGGTLSADFSRTESFCGKRNMYCLRNCAQCRWGFGERNLNGFKRVDYNLGERNIVGGMLTWLPAKTADVGAEGEADAGSASAPLFQLHRIGVFAFEEFRNHLDEYSLYYGVASMLTIPAEINLELEVASQSLDNQNAMAYLVAGDRLFDSTVGVTSLRLGYVGGIALDKGAHFKPSFSRLCLGEVIALDTIDLPIVFSGIRHTMPWKKPTSVKVAYVVQPEGFYREWDFAIVHQMFKMFQLELLYSWIDSKIEDPPVKMVALHQTWTF